MYSFPTVCSHLSNIVKVLKTLLKNLKSWLIKSHLQYSKGEKICFTDSVDSGAVGLQIKKKSIAESLR